MGRSIRRRDFVKTLATASAAFGVPQWIPASALGRDNAVAPSERITLGFIGVGDHGVGMNLRNFLPQPDAQVVALCDVDGSRITRAEQVARDHYSAATPSGRYGALYATRDWRDIIARQDVDAVVVSTPDHWHVLPSVFAARAGKDVFCEKPLTLTVQEGRILSDTIARYGRVFQTASENRSKWNFLRACELTRNGYIGRLHTIRTVLPRGFRHPLTPIQPPPDDLDWDMWLGQAPWRPYCEFGMERCHYQWRWIYDYSGGQISDWGAHINDIAQWGAGTEYTGPVSVEAWGDIPSDGLYNTPVEFRFVCEYRNGMTLICTSGTPGVRFEGDGGWIQCGWDSFEASSRELQTVPLSADDIRLRTNPQGEQRDFLDCVKNRRDPYYPVEVGHRSVSIAHIANISLRLGRKLQWDPDAERFPGDERANRMLSRSMREPWTL